MYGLQIAVGGGKVLWLANPAVKATPPSGGTLGAGAATTLKKVIITDLFI